MEAEEAVKKEFVERKAKEEERPEVYSPVERGSYHAPEGKTMKVISLIFAVISLIGVLLLTVVVYDMSGKVSGLADAQGAGQSNIAANVAKLQSAADRLAEGAKTLEQNYAKLAAETQQNGAGLTAAKAQAEQNKAAIDDMKTRINRLIDLIK